MECKALNIKTAAKIPQKFLYLNQATEKYTCQFSCPKKCRNQKFQTQKNPSVIPVTGILEYPPRNTSNTSKAVKLKYVCSSLQEGVIN